MARPIPPLCKALRPQPQRIGVWIGAKPPPMDRNSLLCSAYASALPAPANNAAPEWVQLFPLGRFSTNDGRSFELKNADKVITASAANLPAPIDYDHGAERPADATLNSRAAAWMTELSAHGPNGEDGLWAKVDWTPAGGKAVADKEYRFLSPSFMHSKDGNVVTNVFRAALTNTAALRGQIKALASTQPENSMLKKYAAALGLAETATEDDVLAAITAMRTGQTALCAQVKSFALAAGLAADKVGDGSKLGETEASAICAKLKTPAADTGLQKQVDDLQLKVATLTQASAGSTATTKVEAAITAGKITPAQKDWAIGYCTREPVEFDKYVAAAPVILKDGRLARQSAGESDALNEEELAICAQLKLDPKDFKAEKAKREGARS